MKRLVKNLKSIIIMLAVSAGIICFFGGFAFEKRVPKNVTVGGVQVGGQTISRAAKKLRESTIEDLKQKSLNIYGERAVYRFVYPEISFKDNLYTVLKNAQKGGEYFFDTSYYLCGKTEVALGICLSERIETIEPYAAFSAFGEPFKYFEGHDGKEVDKAKLLKDINASLSGGFEDITLSYKPVKRQRTLKDVKAETCILNSFTTNFDGTNLNRTSNIRLAASKLNGTVIEGGQTISFNDIVGDRVKERGFLTAKIIENGEFTEGVGGGVCQVSTTLYNAALLSGLEITEYHPHSLSVGYVPPSRDAMVSGRTFDLKIKNNSKTPVYIRAHTTDGSITFDIYGKSNGAKYSLSSTVTGTIAAPEEKTGDPASARPGKDGLTSESYLEVTKNGYKKTVLLRKDKYLPVKKVTYLEENQEEEENTATTGKTKY